MTLRGILVVVLEIFFIILAFGTEFKNFLIIALCLGGLIAFSLLSLVLASVSLGANSTVDTKAARRGEKINFNFAIYGIALLPVAVYFFVKTTDTKFSTKRKFRHSFLLLPTFLVNRKFVFEMPCVHIGEWEIGIKKMRVEDLFGFFSLPIVWCNKKNLLKNITVQPRIHDLGEVSERDSNGGQGATNLLNSENGELMGDSRLYKEGDTLKRINWKLTARTKKLYSRIFETTQEPTVVVVMDTAVYGEKQDYIVDISCESAISLSYYFTSRNTPVKLVFARFGDAGVKTYKLIEPNDIFKIYANFSNTIFKSDKKALELSSLQGMQILNSNKIYIISGNPSDELVSTADDMRKQGRIACCIVPCGEDTPQSNTARTGDAVLLPIATADQIKEKVGEVV